jgi:hypothetical protein
VPNIHAIPLLAPLTDPDICPYWNERWEVRTRTLGCHVSTITFLTAVGSVLGTLVFLGLVWGLVKMGRWGRKVWRGREEGWWRAWRWNPSLRWRWRGAWRRGVRGEETERCEDGETRPLLRDEGDRGGHAER